MKVQNQQNTQNKKFAKGFTLLELLVVVVIIGILAAIALPQYKMAVYKSRYKSLMALTNAIYQAEEVYYLANNNYTDNLTALDVDLPGCEMSSDKKECVFDWGKCSVSLSTASSTIGDCASCYRTEGLKNAYVYYFRVNSSPITKKQRMCFAKRKDHTAEGGTVWEQVCEKVGATKTFSSAECPILHACSLWTF